MSILFGQDWDLWPDEAAQKLSQEWQENSALRLAFLLYRASQYARAEAILLSLVDGADSFLSEQIYPVLCLIWISSSSTVAAKELCFRFRPSLGCDQIWWFCHQLLLIAESEYENVLELGLPPDPHPLLRTQFAEAALWINRLGEAQYQLQLLQNAGCRLPEYVQANARYLLMTGRDREASQCVSALLERSRGSELTWELAVHLLQAEQGGNASSAILHRALTFHRKSHRLHARQLLRHILARRPAAARRHGLLQRLYVNKNISAQDQERSDSNLCMSYEHLGRADIVPFLHRDVKDRMALNPHAVANNLLQLASVAHPGYSESLRPLLDRLPSQISCHHLPLSGRSLRLGLVSPDFNYHPVGRFVTMMLSQGLGLGGELHLVASGGREDPTTRLIADLVDQQGSFHSVKGLSQADQLAKIRELKLDVAIDLAGWTGENSGVLFASRIAPVQVNYLGYFASTGIPAMDFWLGDVALFPEPMQEWHSEQIWRLPRCFLAWQPSSNLPEGQVEVPAAAAPSVPITFGSFNHSRKLSAGTLRLWGELLRTVPGSRLALKSYTTDDPGTVQLLRQRMLRCGLDPERVLWLPTCPTAEEHLRQYGLVDIALDPFPNGGCTTTCEALWMGVPVITLRGDHYVSRMSTAVLQGAGMPEWIAASESEYLALAQRAAAERSNLRQMRANWRLRLQRSPLGDAAGLNQALWQAFAAMPAALKAG